MPTRREFLTSACTILTLGIGAPLLGDAAEAADGIQVKANGQVVLTLALIPALRRVGGVANLGFVKGRPVAVVRTRRNRYVAVDLTCTHEGTTVKRSVTGWTCPNHGSEFRVAGALVEGPADYPLARIPVRLTAGKLTVG